MKDATNANFGRGVLRVDKIGEPVVNSLVISIYKPQVSMYTQRPIFTVVVLWIYRLTSRLRRTAQKTATAQLDHYPHRRFIMEFFSLSEIQAKLKAPKNQFNKFGNYYYRSCEDILEAVKPLLTPYNVALVIWDEIVQVGDRYYVKAFATIKQGEKELERVTAFAREAENKKGMDESQVTGAASSYARKYALNGLFAIEDTKDADATNKHGQNGEQSKPKETKPQSIPRGQDEPYSDKQRKMLYAKIKGIDDSLSNEEVSRFNDFLKQKFGTVKDGDKEVLPKGRMTEIFDNLEKLFDEFVSWQPPQGG